MYNPLVRSTCSPCGNNNLKCNLTFHNKRNHPLATYLAYAWYLMISHPDVYAEPNFSPDNWPNPAPDKDDIAWFRAQYNTVPRGRTSRRGKTNIQAADDGEELPPPAEDALDPTVTSEVSSAHEEMADELPQRHTVVRRTRSRSVSVAPSVASSTAHGTSSTAHGTSRTRTEDISRASLHTRGKEPPSQSDQEGAEDPPSPDARSEASSAWMSVDFVSIPDDGENLRLPDLAHLGPVTDYVDKEINPSGGGSSSVPLERGRPLASGGNVITCPSDMKQLQASTLIYEVSRPSSARIRLPDMPPPPFEARKHARIPFMVKEIGGAYLTLHRIRILAHVTATETYDDLPRLGRSLETGLYVVVDPPHDDDETLALLKALLSIGREGLDVVERLDEAHTEPLQPSPSRNITPQRDPFLVSDNVIQLIYSTKAKFEEMENLRLVIEESAASLDGRAHGTIHRHLPFTSQLPVGLAVAEDLRDVYTAIARVHEILAHFSTAFSMVPALPWNWISLLDKAEHRSTYR